MRRLWLTAALLAVALPACRSDRLVFTTYTKVGLDLSSSNGAAAGILFGYKRFEGALVPVDMSKATGEPEDLMSIFAAIDLENGWFQGIKLLQVFATGKAAVQASQGKGAIAEVIAEYEAGAEDDS